MRLLFLLAALAAVPALAQAPPTASNDDLEFAFPLAPNAPAEIRTASTVGATADPMVPEPGASCSPNENNQSVWWYVRPTANGTMSITTIGSSFDTVLSVYEVILTSEVGCNDDNPTGAGGTTSAVSGITLTAGNTYYIRVSGRGAATGTVQIAMTSSAVTGPPNDPYPALETIPTGFGRPGPRLGFNTGATVAVTSGEPSPPPACTSQPTSHSVWWTYFNAAAGFLTVDLAGSAFDTVLLITDLNGTVLACNDDVVQGVLQSRIANLPVAANTRYRIRVASYGPAPATTGLIRFNTAFSQTVGTEGDVSTSGLALRAPRPNPASGTSVLSFVLDASGPARLSVIDALGREVTVAFDGAAPAGETEARVDVSALPVGVYVARLVAGGRVESQRLTVVR